MHFTVLRINFFLLVFFCCAQLFSQAPISRLYGTEGTETGKAGFILADSTIYALGTSSAFPSLSSQIYLLKTDKNGNILWSKFYGGPNVDDAVDMFVDLAVDSSIYIIANSYIGFTKGYDVKIIKVDINGNLIWEKNYGTTDWDIPAKMIKTSTNMFAICGKTYGSTFGLADGMMLLLDNNGDSLVFKNYGDAENNYFLDLIERSSDTLVFCGESYTASGKKRAWIFELNIETGMFSNSYFGNVYNRTFNSIENYTNGDYLISVTTDSIGVTQTDIFVEVLDKNSHAQKLEIPVLEVNDEIAVEVKFFNNYFHFLGLTKTYGLGGWEAVVYIFNDTGAYIYSKTFGTSADDFCAFIMPNNNNTFAFVGTSGGVFGVTDLWIVNLDSVRTNIPLLDSQLDINSIHESENNKEVFSVYPNPFSDIINISSSTIPARINVADYSGRVVRTITNSISINLSDLSSGTYFLNVMFDDQTGASKCIVKLR